VVEMPMPPMAEEKKKLRKGKEIVPDFDGYVSK
jgi:hypothetical protein